MTNRNLWRSFEIEKFPVWICSKCNVGIYELQPQHFLNFEDSDTLTEKKHDYFDDEFVRYRFSAVLLCNNKQCNETSIMTGTGKIEEYDWEGEQGFESIKVKMFYPEYCCPPPALFKIPESTPENISNLILSSFSIFFSDPNSAANKLRKCLEEILKNENIPQNQNNYTLGSRLETLCKKYSLNSNELYKAVQFIGDEGSHGGNTTINLTLDDILVAYKLFDFLLNELYNRTHIENLKQISTKYTKQ